jgi:ribonucleoside-diphosphate reductase alpha chain
VSIRQLDNLCDLTNTPIPQAMNSNQQNRAVGLGIMGFSDVLEKLGYSYESDEAYDLIDQLTEFISYHAIDASADLAKERGSYPTFKGSGWSKGMLPIDTLDQLELDRGVKVDISRKTRLDWEKLRAKVKKGMRNATLMAIAPTATIANISGCLPSIEPIYKNLYVKSNFSGEFTVVNHALIDDLRPLGRHPEIFAIVAVGAIAMVFEFLIPNSFTWFRTGVQSIRAFRFTSIGIPRSLSSRSRVSIGNKLRSHFDPLYEE